jgi:hypothetical protein
MKRSPVLLVVAAVLFAAWIGWLAFLAAPYWRTSRPPIILSRPQFLVADLYVVADVHANPAADEPDNVVTIKQLAWSSNPADARHDKIFVTNLSKMDAQHGWQGPNEYVLALTRTQGRRGRYVFLVTALPKTPGFPGELGRIYLATPQTLRQLEKLKEEYHP